MWSYIVKFKTIIIVVVAVVSLIAGGTYAVKHWGVPGLLQGIFEDRSQEVRDQYEAEIQIKDAQIESYKTQLSKSKAEALKLRSKVKELEAKIQNVQVPTSVQETKRRFTDLGYPPVR